MTDMQIPIVVPFEIVNDKEVTLIEWVRQSGEPVSKNETIAIIETSKMNVDLSAPADGFLKHLHKIGTDIPVGEIIGYVSNKACAIFQETGNTAVADPKDFYNDKQLQPPSIQFSKKAKELMTKNNLAPEFFYHLPLVKEADVLDFLKNQSQKKSPAIQKLIENEIKISRTKRAEIENLNGAKNQTVKSMITSLMLYPYSIEVKEYLQDNQLALLIFETARLLTQFTELNT